MPQLKVPVSELNLALTLPSGQCFRWKKRAIPSPTGDVWLGIIGRRVIELVQDISQGTIHYEILNESSIKDASQKRLKTSDEDIFREYFQLDTSLTDLYTDWSSRDDLFQKVSSQFPGVRVMRQDPVETVFSFLCSSCNNIKRISGMIDKMCIKYGQHLLTDHELGPIHAFPEVNSLTGSEVETSLRSLGFGYRAKYIYESAKLIDSGVVCLQSLRSKPYEEAKGDLMKLPGIGRKVADCICLFSLDQKHVIPVDTHVYQIASRHYVKQLDTKSKAINQKTYELVASSFQDRFGPFAGWAHSVLFTADLSMFKKAS